ncbi:MAG: SWIM zinc finger family protein, partial [Terracidiphilus sp.]
CQQKSGLFPSPNEIELSCSCPDWADMCKHVAAVLYGIGARLDQQPELLFRLHKVDERELIARAGNNLPLAKNGPAAANIPAAAKTSPHSLAWIWRRTRSPMGSPLPACHQSRSKGSQQTHAAQGESSHEKKDG